MESNLKSEERTALVGIHKEALRRIDDAIAKESYVEACWYIYACFESRVNGILVKTLDGCPKTPRSNGDRPLGIDARIKCINGLALAGYELFEGSDLSSLPEVNSWCKKRNQLVHKLIRTETFTQADDDFKRLAKQGVRLVKKMYKAADVVRENFYSAREVPACPAGVSANCPRKKQCLTRI